MRGASVTGWFRLELKGGAAVPGAGRRPSGTPHTPQTSVRLFAASHNNNNPPARLTASPPPQVCLLFKQPGCRTGK